MFKNLRLFRLTAPFEIDPEALHDLLAAQAFRPCGRIETSSFGWVAPFGRHSDRLTHAVAGAILICARKEEKILPSAVVNEQLEAKVNAIAARDGREVKRKERKSLKEEVILELLPKAFTRSSYTYAYLAPREGWLVVDTTSAKRAEELLALLRRSAESLRAALPTVQNDPVTVMSRWISGNGIPPDLTLGEECELKEPGDEGGVIRGKRVDLLSDEIAIHLAAGKQAVKMALRFEDRFTFLLEGDLAIKRLRFEDTVLDQLDNEAAADEISSLDAQFALLSLEVRRFLPRLLEWFGGEAKSDAISAGPPLSSAA